MMRGKGAAAALLLMGKPRRKEEEDSEDMDEEMEDTEDAEKAAMEDFISAVQDSDAKAALAAFKDLMELCSY